MVFKFFKEENTHHLKEFFDEYLTNYKRRHYKIYNIYKLADEFGIRLTKHHIFMFSSGIAFNIILYLIPLFLLSIYFIGLIIDVRNLSETLEKIIKELLPASESTYKLIALIIEEVHEILDNSKLAGIIGLVSLLWVSSTFFSSLRAGINTVFEIPSPKFFIFYKIKDIALTLIVSLLILISTYLFPIATIISSTYIQYLPAPLNFYFSNLFVLLVSVIITYILYYFIFRLVPNKKLPNFIRISSTVICVISIEIFKYLFAWYLTKIANLGKFYGTYAIIASIAVWIYYLSFIILISAEISQFIYDKKFHKTK